MAEKLEIQKIKKDQKKDIEKLAKNQVYIFALVLILLAVILITFMAIQRLSDETAAGQFGFFGASDMQCQDSDGLDYYARGYAIYKNTQVYDSCTSYMLLKEGYCNNDKYAFVSYSCPYGCNNGACLSINP
jgi:hypothetical protein